MKSMTKNEAGSIVSEIAIFLLFGLLLFAFIVYDIWYYVIPWVLSKPIEAIEVTVITLSIGYILWKCAKATIEYFGKGTGTWIIEVIHAIRGTDDNGERVTQQKSIEEKAIRLYDADPDDVRDAIDVLVKFGWKKAEAAQRVHSIVVGASLDDVNSVTKIVKKVLAEVK